MLEDGLGIMKPECERVFDVQCWLPPKFLEVIFKK